MQEVKQKYEEIKKRSQSLQESSESLINDYYSISKEFEEKGNLYLSAESLRTAARKLLEKGTIDIKRTRTAAVNYEEAASKFYSVNNYKLAARCIKEAAAIYEGVQDYKEAYRCYGLAKNYFGDAGDYDECGIVYFNEMDNKRKYYKHLLSVTPNKKFNNKVTYFIKLNKYNLFKITTNYGESIGRLFLTSLITILFFSLVYFFLQGVYLSDNNNDNYFHEKTDYSFNYFMVCLKFSLSLFSGYSTTPYLLIKFNIISTIEVIFGNIILALFIAIILRKISRR